MTIVDRRYSVAEGTAVKAPCRVATTANITLSGEQTIDGVAVVADDRVLVKNQTTGSENGIYTASTGNWSRARDFDGAYDVVNGTRVYINAGTAGANREYYVSTTDPITIDTTSITFAVFVAGTAGAGNVVGPASSTDSAYARFDGLTGRLLKDGAATIPLADLAIHAASALTAPATADELGIYDASGALVLKITLANFFKVIALLTADTGPAIDDSVVTYDLSGTSAKSVALSDLLKVVDGLTEDVGPDLTADFMLTYDVSAASAKKVKLSAVSSPVTVTTQAAQETATDNTTFVSPGRQHFHPSALKAWVKFNSAGTVAASYNITSITDNGTGDWTVNIATDFSSANYCGVALCGVRLPGGDDHPLALNIGAAAAAGTFRLKAYKSDAAITAGDPTAPDEIYAMFAGDQ